MDKRNLTTIVQAIRVDDPSPLLLEGVMAAICAARRRSFVRWVTVTVIGLALSAAGTAYAIVQTLRQASASGLPQFLSAAATDTGAVLASWQSYVLAVADALPVVQLAVTCAMLFVFFALLRRLDRTITRSHLHSLTHA